MGYSRCASCWRTLQSWRASRHWDGLDRSLHALQPLHVPLFDLLFKAWTSGSSLEWRAVPYGHLAGGPALSASFLSLGPFALAAPLACLSNRYQMLSCSHRALCQRTRHSWLCTVGSALSICSSFEMKLPATIMIGCLMYLACSLQATIEQEWAALQPLRVPMFNLVDWATSVAPIYYHRAC